MTCLLLDGNRAVVGGVIEEAANPDQVGWTLMFAVEDNGDPESGAPLDQLSLIFSRTSWPTL